MIGKTEGQRLLGRPKLRMEDNIKMANKYCGRVWTGFIWFGIETVG
jgi:hypothetical protein